MKKRNDTVIDPDIKENKFEYDPRIGYDSDGKQYQTEIADVEIEQNPFVNETIIEKDIPL